MGILHDSPGRGDHDIVIWTLLCLSDREEGDEGKIVLIRKGYLCFLYFYVYVFDFGEKSLFKKLVQGQGAGVGVEKI